ncbi:MAG: hypothetical protein V8S93_05405 [Lachnospiraceae bacterium]
MREIVELSCEIRRQTFLHSNPGIANMSVEKQNFICFIIILSADTYALIGLDAGIIHGKQCRMKAKEF